MGAVYSRGRCNSAESSAVPGSSTDEHEITVSGSNNGNTVNTPRHVWGRIFLQRRATWSSPWALSRTSAEMATLQQFPNFHFFAASAYRTLGLSDSPWPAMMAVVTRQAGRCSATDGCRRRRPCVHEPKTITMTSTIKHHQLFSRPFQRGVLSHCPRHGTVAYRDRGSHPVGLIQSAWAAPELRLGLCRPSRTRCGFSSTPHVKLCKRAFQRAMINPWATFQCAQPLVPGEANADEKIRCGSADLLCSNVPVAHPRLAAAKGHW